MFGPAAEQQEGGRPWADEYEAKVKALEGGQKEATAAKKGLAHLCSTRPARPGPGLQRAG